uniref:Uncharacterized protein n=1 Tax=Anopheles culicifacies TaxID=139723 RepID=A0A182MM39_9DIPT
MYTINKNTYDMMKCNPTSGTLEKSKILNCLLWNSSGHPETVPAINGATIRQYPIDRNEKRVAPNAAYSVMDKLDKHAIWTCLRVPNAEEDECEYCGMQPDEKRMYFKHQMYTNGKLTCPVLLTLE